MPATRYPEVTATIRASVVLLATGALVLIAGTLSGADPNSTACRALGNALFVVLLTLTATSGVTLVKGRSGPSWFGYLTAAISLVAIVGVTVATWGDVNGGFWGKAIGITAVLSLAGAHTCILLGPKYQEAGSTVRSLRNVTLALLAGFASFLIYAIASSGDSVDGKLIAVVFILYGLGSLVLPLARRASLAANEQGSLEISPAEILHDHGFELVEGPVGRTGAHGTGEGVSMRQADGTLVELITYDRA